MLRTRIRSVASLALLCGCGIMPTSRAYVLNQASRLLAAPAITLFPGTVNAMHHVQHNDEQILREMIAQQGLAWNRGDAKAWASFFSEDARFVTLRGDMFPNRAAIEKSHHFIFSSFYKGSHIDSTVESLTMPSADVAVIDVLHEVSNYASLPPGISPTEPGILRARMKYVAVRHNNRWQFSSAQNTAVFPKLPA